MYHYFYCKYNKVVVIYKFFIQYRHFVPGFRGNRSLSLASNRIVFTYQSLLSNAFFAFFNNGIFYCLVLGQLKFILVLHCSVTPLCQYAQNRFLLSCVHDENHTRIRDIRYIQASNTYM